MRFQTESITDLFAEALGLTALPLLDVRARGLSAREQLRSGMERLGFRDEETIAATIDEWKARPASMVDRVRKLKRAVFCLERGITGVRRDPTAQRLMRLIDPDLLMSVPSNSGAQVFPSWRHWPTVPTVSHEQVAELLAHGSHESHIHLGGALPAVYFWVILMGGELSPTTIGGLAERVRGHAPDSDWRQSLTRAFWCRYWLASALDRHSRAVTGTPAFAQIRPEAWARLQLDRDAPPGLGPPRRFHRTDIAWELIPNHMAQRQAYTERQHRERKLRPPWPFLDPLRRPGCRLRIFPQAYVHYAEGERRLVSGLFRMLENLDTGREPVTVVTPDRLAQYLRTYLRIRNAFHHLLCHDQGSHGLHRFVETFARRGKLFEGGAGTSAGSRRRRQRQRRTWIRFERCRIAAALDSQLVEPFEGDAEAATPRQIELRVSLSGGPDLQRIIRAWANGIRDHLRLPSNIPGDGEVPSWDARIDDSSPERFRPHQVGLVVHAIKKGDRPHHRDAALEDAVRYWHLLRDYPQLRGLFVGFDAAGRERLAPPRTFAPAYHHLQNRGHRFARCGTPPPIRLGYTFHVGEDCADMLTALRHLDETAHLLLPEEGGRLGHALMLGEDPERFYAQRNGFSKLSIGTHLLSLVWAWGRLREADELDHHAWLAPAIQALAASGGDLRLSDCFTAMDLPEHDDAAPWQLSTGRPTLRHPAHSETELLNVLGFHGNAGSSVSIHPEPHWFDLVRSIQTLMLERLRQREVCIEANPTSNLLMGCYGNYAELPQIGFAEAGLAVSVSTDDPGLFMTSLPSEFANLAEDLRRRKGWQTSRIQAWLEARLADSGRNSFIHAGIGVPSPGRLFHYRP
ncbi:A-deaminase domain-containing protein [Sulfidibacter corallicola]|uniref:adenosine deaminase n=1 Tax=Sulfidibacter corallicola TaxID=2818388 RepID=A0A8A4TUM0_SULCO|nr:hypothetical protein [Sulfidibacter corallicola]QTD52811.1 hypothetical protein J3U87_10070 [Sulfidibacter corallicola]